MKIYTADSLKKVDELDAESVHAIVTDPPYGLAFMGRDWDDFEPKEYQEWCEDWARKAKRVLKPGGHLLAFSGNRTHHRLFTGVEDAGYEIRDTITWHYGCLSEDTEVLTPDGWKSHAEIGDGNSVVAFDPDTNTFNVEATNRVFEYEHDGAMVRYQSPHTDQLVTPNHRVLHRVNREWKTTYACNTHGNTELPVIHGTKQHTTERTRRNGVDNLCKVRRDKVVSAGSGRGTELLFSGVLPELPQGGRGYVRTPAGDSGTRARGVDRGNQAPCVGENERREQPGVEGRRHREESKGQLQAREVGSVPRRVLGNGTGERLRAGTPLEGSKGVGAAAHVHGSSTSQGPRQPQQRLRESGTVAKQPASQVGGGEPRRVPIGTTVARTTRVDYSGTVWCVNVPSSYFVARRNGQVFITGNSGFPKASDISKTIDKRADAKREVVGPKTAPDGSTYNERRQHDNTQEHEGYQRPWKNDPEKVRENNMETAPATDAAKKWDGFKTGLKPATEYVVVARKPFDGATVDSVLENGTGALNIDGTRIEANDGERNANPNWGSTDKYAQDEWTQDKAKERNDKDATTTEGRYPSNVVFDEIEAERLDREVGELSSGKLTAEMNNNADSTRFETTYGEFKRGGQQKDYQENSGGPSRYFYTSKASKSERTENGSIDNAHPTVKPVDLMEWLVTLVTKENQIVLDPFCGSGTTGKACKHKNREFIGIEKQPKWADVARVRCGLTPEDPSVVREDDSQQGLEQF